MLLENYTSIDCRHVVYFGLFVSAVGEHPRSVVGGNLGAIPWALLSDILAELNAKGASSHSSDRASKAWQGERVVSVLMI